MGFTCLSNDRSPTDIIILSFLKRSGRFIVSERGMIEVKGKGRMLTYWLEGLQEQRVTTQKSRKRTSVARVLVPSRSAPAGLA